MEKYVTLPLFFVSVPINGNNLIVIVFSRWWYGNNLTDILYRILAVADAPVIVKMECILDPFVALRKDVCRHSAITCKFAVFVSLWFRTFSLWIIVVLVTERLICVCWPHQVNTKWKYGWPVLVTVNLSCVLYLPFRWQLFTYPLSWMDRQLVFATYMDTLKVLEGIHPISYGWMLWCQVVCHSSPSLTVQ